MFLSGSYVYTCVSDNRNWRQMKVCVDCIDYKGQGHTRIPDDVAEKWERYTKAMQQFIFFFILVAGRDRHMHILIILTTPLFTTHTHQWKYLNIYLLTHPRTWMNLSFTNFLSDNPLPLKLLKQSPKAELNERSNLTYVYNGCQNVYFK